VTQRFAGALRMRMPEMQQYFSNILFRIPVISLRRADDCGSEYEFDTNSNDSITQPCLAAVTASTAF
jgi:hypothetical protein